MFDHIDFVANPRKYEMFKTAKVAVEGLGGLSVGRCVAVAYLRTQFHPTNCREEPVYHVRGVGPVWAFALSNFVL